jgi:hypothetical protein
LNPQKDKINERALMHILGKLSKLLTKKTSSRKLLTGSRKGLNLQRAKSRRTDYLTENNESRKTME